jgi:hypothetical protein
MPGSLPFKLRNSLDGYLFPAGRTVDRGIALKDTVEIEVDEMINTCLEAQRDMDIYGIDEEDLPLTVLQAKLANTYA